MVLYHNFDLLFGKINTAFNCRKDESSLSGTSLVSKFPVVHEDQDIADIGNTNIAFLESYFGMTLSFLA